MQYRNRSYGELDELFGRGIPARHFAMTKTKEQLARENQVSESV